LTVLIFDYQKRTQTIEDTEAAVPLVCARKLAPEEKGRLQTFKLKLFV